MACSSWGPSGALRNVPSLGLAELDVVDQWRDVISLLYLSLTATNAVTVTYPDRLVD